MYLSGELIISSGLGTDRSSMALLSLSGTTPQCLRGRPEATFLPDARSVREGCSQAALHAEGKSPEALECPVVSPMVASDKGDEGV